MNTIYLAGICCDHNSTYLRGASAAPVKIRRALHSNSTNLFSEKGCDIEKTIAVDLGDHHIEDTEHGYLTIETIAAQVVNQRNPLLSLGGDHSITYPLIRAFAREYGPLSILHFDAHPDLYDHYQGNRYAHACPFARIMEEGLASRLIQVGIRTLTPHQSEQAKRFGVEIHQMRDLDISTMHLDIAGPLYISLDMDVLDPAFAPGVSHHEPGGMTVREVLKIIHSQNAAIVGADIVEYNPSRDINEMTAMAAAKFVKEIAAQMVL